MAFEHNANFTVDMTQPGIGLRCGAAESLLSIHLANLERKGEKRSAAHAPCFPLHLVTEVVTLLLRKAAKTEA